MKPTLILLLLFLCNMAVADAETYRWTDDRGVASFTDNPALIPTRYRSNAQRGQDITIHKPGVRQELVQQKKKIRQVKAPKARVVTTPAGLQSTPSTVGMQKSIKGHLGGDQVDPAPPSMQQPKAEPLGDQPSVTFPGMKQPKSAPMGKQPVATPSGMKQPKPEPMGDQPTSSPAGMEQPSPKQ